MPRMSTWPLEKLEEQGLDCQPKASTIRIIQDKYLQKLHFSKHAIPLPEFMRIDNLENTKLAGDVFGYPLKIKSRKLAYDERGNAVAKSENDIPSAVTVARGRDNSILCYPVVETMHKENICHVVKSPADIPWKVKELATSVAREAVGSLEGAGVSAVELFLTEDDEGEQGFRQSDELIAQGLSIPGLSVHWYDKPCQITACFALMVPCASTIPSLFAGAYSFVRAEMRKQRKMGHITIVGSSLPIVEGRLNSLLQGESSDGQSTDADLTIVGIIMGSDSDLPVMKEAAWILNITPELMVSYAKSTNRRGVRVIIAGASGAAHLPGMVAAMTPLPVIGVPVRASSLDGLDSLLSIVQMPRGVPVATVAINNATNAGLLAVRILGNIYPELQARMTQYMDDVRDDVLD
ncbi:Phosphoribosylaminoimidazole carboxylase, chloroplastic-like protein [Drosera capensis]